jgi:predicted ATPase
MWIKRAEIWNLKSFHEPTSITFDRGFNLIIGTNNAGKSTLLQALDMGVSPTIPHRSAKTAVNPETRTLGRPGIVLELSSDVPELRSLRTQDTWLLPIRQERQEEIRILSSDAQFRLLLGESELSLSVRRTENGIDSLKFSGQLIDSRWLGMNGEAYGVVQIAERADGGVGCSGPNNLATAANHIWQSFRGVEQVVYRFEASRLPVASTELSINGKLSPNASNLAGCIAWLQGTSMDGHRRLCGLVNRVLPGVHSVQAVPTGSGLVQLRCFPRRSAEERLDLAVSIDQMGSGVGNVVALLYVALTARAPQVICIDELNQFLHPRALRELIDILATEGKQHQYILTAHSAELIGAVRASTITLLTMSDGVTTVRQTGREGLATLRHGFADLGIRATELNGRDRVLWVEGQTEELVLPGLLAHFCKEHAAGTAVLRVLQTGSFEKKRVDPIDVAEIYKRLTSASALVPPMVAVVLDRERRSADECSRLETDRRATLRFLPRSMIENYLIHPGALAFVLTKLGHATDPQTVAAALAAEAGTSDLNQIDFENVGAAKLLSDAFNTLSQATHPFVKTRDVPAIVDWLLENDPNFLKPLGEWLRSLMSEVTETESTAAV